MDHAATARSLKRRVLRIRGPADEDDCPICMRALGRDTVVYLPCGHPLHLSCEKQLRDSRCAARNACPLCRAPIDAACAANRAEEDFEEEIMAMLAAIIADLAPLADSPLTSRDC